MGKATEYCGIPQLLKGTAPTPEQQWKLAARLNALRHVLVDKGVVTREEIDDVEAKILASMQDKRAQKIRDTTFTGSK